MQSLQSKDAQPGHRGMQTAQKMKFSIKSFLRFSQFLADFVVAFTEEIFNGKLQFFVQ